MAACGRQRSSLKANFNTLININLDKSLQPVSVYKKDVKLGVLNAQSLNNRSAHFSFHNSKIKIAHLNVRSFKNRDHLIEMRQLAHENNYNVIAISESWLNSSVINTEVEIAGYKLYRMDRLNRLGGDVCVYTRC